MPSIEKKQKSLNDTIYNRIKDDILTGVLKAGDSLTPIRELAKQMSVSKNTVNSAYVRLVKDGYVYSVKGSGYYVENRETAENADISLDISKSSDMLKYFDWEKWKGCILDAVDGVKNGEDINSKLIIQNEISKYIKNKRGLDIKAENIVLCSDIYNCIECLRELFKNISNDIAFLEPCNPTLRAMFQEDFFSIKGFDRRVGTKDDYEKGRFRILFGYVEQYIKEFEREYPDNMWIQKWISETGSFILMFDEGISGDVNISDYTQLSCENIIFAGSFERSLPSDMPFCYIALPQRLITKFKNMISYSKNIYPISYQRALASFMTDGFKQSVEKTIENKKRFKEAFAKKLSSIFKDNAKIVESYDYMTDGIVVEFKDITNQSYVLSSLKNDGIKIGGGKSYWYFYKNAGEKFLIFGYDNYDIDFVLNKIKCYIK